MSAFVLDLFLEFGKTNPCHVPSGPPGGQSCSGAASGLTGVGDRSTWPQHIQDLKVPPAWTDVRINPDPKADLQVIGRDAKGRAQYVYSKSFQDKQAQAKFHRIKELDAKYDKIRNQNDANRRSSDPKIREHADCAALVVTMGVRPGSTADTGAKVQAYGATTLLGKHVVQKGGETRLQFTGKKGVKIDLPVADRSVAGMLKIRAKSAGPNAELFPQVSGSSLLSYSHTLNGGKFKTKDFRTLRGTREAQSLMKAIKPPTSAKEYRKSVMVVAKGVATKLGNTPTVALQSYIHPAVFAPWRASYGTT